MAKQKKQKLYCDQLIGSNIKFINKCNGIVSADKLFPIVADSYVEQAITKGTSYAEVINSVTEKLMTIKSMSEMASLTALNNWYWSGRQIYRFDKELAEMLYSQTKDDIAVDINTLNLLPTQHFYISLEDSFRHGFFVSITNDNNDIVLYIADMTNDHTEAYGIIIPKEAKMLSDIIIHCNKLMKQQISQKDVKDLSQRITLYIQFIVYLSAINAEIEPVTKGAVTTRQAGQKQYTKHDKTEISNVGYRLGEALRVARKEPANIKYVGEYNQGSPKSPHIRRSHFHSYWIGSGDDKELIVKWVNTIFVKGGIDNISTVHDIKYDNTKRK